MVITPSCSTCADGKIIIEVKQGPLRPFQFWISGPGIISPQWTGPDIFGKRKKTYPGLQKGTYIVRVYTGPSMTVIDESCVEEYIIEVPDPCPTNPESVDPCGNGTGSTCDRHSLQLWNPNDLVNYNPVGTGVTFQHQYGYPEYLRFRNLNPNGPGSFPHYQFGVGNWAVEFWVKPYEAPGFSDIFSWAYSDLTTAPSRGISLRLASTSLLRLEHINAANSLVETTSVGLNLNEWNHVVISKIGATTGINSATDVYRLYVNGIDASTAVSNTLAPIEDNVNILTGDLVFGVDWYEILGSFVGASQSNVDSISRDGTANALHGEYTNIRMYGRSMPKSEVQKNYLLGCAGDPSNCNKLVLLAYLNQDNGNLTQEVINQNNGELINYITGRKKVGGDASVTPVVTAAWKETCCIASTEFDRFICCAQDCEEDTLLVSFKIDQWATANPNPVYFGFDFTTSTCISDRSAAPNPTLPADVLSGFYWFTVAAPLIASATNEEEAALAIVSLWNALPAATRVGSIASANLSTVTIRFPYSYNKVRDFCGKSFTVCTYKVSVGPGDWGPATDSISYPNTNLGICCLPGTEDAACCNSEYNIDID